MGQNNLKDGTQLTSEIQANENQTNIETSSQVPVPQTEKDSNEGNVKCVNTIVHYSDMEIENISKAGKGEMPELTVSCEPDAKKIKLGSVSEDTIDTNMAEKETKLFNKTEDKNESCDGQTLTLQGNAIDNSDQKSEDNEQLLDLPSHHVGMRSSSDSVSFKSSELSTENSTIESSMDNTRFAQKENSTDVVENVSDIEEKSSCSRTDSTDNVHTLTTPEFNEQMWVPDVDCVDCKHVFKDPSPSEMTMYLHALSYKVS